jgi:hypothetical protein
MKAILNLLFPNADLINDAAEWLIQQVKSQVRKSSAYESGITALRHNLSLEFGCEVDSKQFLKILNLVKCELVKSGIDMLVDDKHMVANRPISFDALV